MPTPSSFLPARIVAMRPTATYSAAGTYALLKLVGLIGTTVKMNLVEKVRLDIGVSEPFVERTVQAIMRSGRTGEVGDGKIFVLPVQKVYRIRTSEEDVEAVTPLV